jgi:hypothetical protein
MADKLLEQNQLMAENEQPNSHTAAGRRDQHAVCSLHGLSVGHLTLTTTPVPLRKPRARHDLNLARPHERRASVCGRRAAFRSGSVPQDAPLGSPLHFPARRPQTEASVSLLRWA